MLKYNTNYSYYTLFLGNRRLKNLATKASSRLQGAFRPSTARAYTTMFRTFMCFCVYLNLNVKNLDVHGILAFMECLHVNQVSVNMISNYLSAIRAKLVVLGLNPSALDHKKVNYYIRALKLNRPMSVTTHNIITLDMLLKIVHQCDLLYMGAVFKAVFLVAFFGFFRLSNLAPHSFMAFDFTRHLAGGDIFFEKNMVKILVKWSKTIQTRDHIKVITLPRLVGNALCPYMALKALFKLYNPSQNAPLFQYKYSRDWKVLIDSKIRKVLSLINKKLHLSPHFFTFHAFRRSGASLAFNANVPIQEIKVQGTWTSDCVWRYIYNDSTRLSEVAIAFQKMLQKS